MNKESETRENHGGERIDELQREIAELRDKIETSNRPALMRIAESVALLY